MPIKWSAVKVTEAIDRLEKLVDLASGPLEEAREVTQEARGIPNLPQYVDDRLCRILDRIGRMNEITKAIGSVRESIPGEALTAEKARLKVGSQQSLL